jgi:tagatose-1,6-bisphosphate aldolase non-catalytic subunit AgaZ/GatZ
MYTIEISLRGTPLGLAVQRKESTDAEALYQKVLQAIQSGHPTVLEMTCDREPDKKAAVLVNEITAVQLSDKSGSTGTGRAAGFFELGS